jgi:hypothetical protein
MTAARMLRGLGVLAAALVALAAALSVRLPEGKDWVDLLQAIGMPTVGLIAAIFAWMNYCISRAKRSDDLFDKRKDLFWRLWELILSAYSTTGDPPEEVDEGNSYWRYWQAYDRQVNRLAVEARFLFGVETERFIRSLHERPPIRVPEGTEERAKVDLPDWLVTHFSPYLEIKP